MASLCLDGEFGHVEVARLLLSKGADICCQSDERDTALYRASNKGHLETVRLLLDKGADVNCRNQKRSTKGCQPQWTCGDSQSFVGQWRQVNCQDKRGKTPLEATTGYRAVKVVHLLVVKGLVKYFVCGEKASASLMCLQIIRVACHLGESQDDTYNCECTGYKHNCEC
jgi:ankyrin repeat protein